ncbi:MULTISPECIES: phage tail tape measure protein [unclassified Vibrio]|nr:MULTISPECIES: phage tail tape measure protein [unclassified Vibrio]NAX44227.1 phage tail tape measure protein [Vibrio sp. V25_P4S6T154]OXX41838.1 phage tail tape measure protein [Vibrio sp. V17_P4S1T151]OXX60697.1 phage tail tape measure protein [Vibrio sp. V15_P4S5T153]OXX67070.1 phage tail tape measure protein [Vibrio sp. V20_P4S3T152]
MADKISLVLDTTVKGLEDIVSTTSAAERLTAAISKQRSEVISLNSQLKKVEGYQSAIKRMEKLREQSKQAELSVSELGKQLEENKAQATGLRVAYSQTQAEIKGLNSQLKKASGDGAERLKVQLHQAQNRLESLNLEMHQGKVRTSDLNSAYKKATQRVAELTDKQTKQRDKLRGLGAVLKESGINTRRLGDEQQRLEQKAEKATAAIAKQNARMKEMQAIQSRIDGRSAKLGEIGSQATSLAIAAAPVAATVWSAVKNESSFADVKKVVNMSPEEAAQMRQWSLKTQASKEGGGLNANDLNAMLAAGGRSGIKDPNDLKQFVLDSAVMGVAFDMEASQAGKTLSDFKAALNLDQKGAMNLAGMVNYISNDSNMDPKQLANVMAREGATAKLAGFTNNDTAALATTMIATGMGDERVSTAVKNISGRLTMGDAASSTQKRALSSIGFDSASLAASMQDDAAGSLLDVLEAIKSAPLEEQSALISQIFGEEVKGAVAALAGNTKEFVRLRKLANESEEVHLKSLQGEFNSRIATSEIGIQLFINKLNRLSVIVGTALLPALNWVLQPLGNAVDMVSNFAEANQGLTAAVGIGVAALITLKGVMLAGKAASLIFGNTLDKSRLFRKGLNRETNESGRAAQFAAKQFSRLNRTLMESGGGARSGRGGRGGSAGRRSRPSSRVRSRNPLARAYNFASTAFTAKRGALPLALGGGALAMTPAMAMAQDALDIGGDVAEGLGKGGLNKLIRPLSMAISTANIATALVDGDTKGAITEGGGLLGGLGGASLGAAIGTAILPGVGTVIGGLAGSFLGDYGGELLGGWFGDKLTNPPDKLMASSDVQSKIEEKERQESVARSLPPIQISTPIYAAPGMDEQKLASLARQEVANALQQQFGSLSGLSIDDSLSISAIDRS